MGFTVGLGQEQAAVSLSTDGSMMTFFAPPSLRFPVRLWVSGDGEPRKVQAQEYGGVYPLTWVQVGHVYRWDVTQGEDNQLVLSHYADARNGFPALQWDEYPGAVATPSGPVPAPSPAPVPGVPAPAGSWFDEQMIAGIPNLYLALGGGLLLLMLAKKKGG